MRASSRSARNGAPFRGRTRSPPVAGTRCASNSSGSAKRSGGAIAADGFAETPGSTLELTALPCPCHFRSGTRECDARSRRSGRGTLPDAPRHSWSVKRLPGRRPARCGLRGPSAAGMRPSSLHGRIHGVSPQPVPGRPTPGCRLTDHECPLPRPSTLRRSRRPSPDSSPIPRSGPATAADGCSRTSSARPSPVVDCQRPAQGRPRGQFPRRYDEALRARLSCIARFLRASRIGAGSSSSVRCCSVTADAAFFTGIEGGTNPKSWHLPGSA